MANWTIEQFLDRFFEVEDQEHGEFITYSVKPGYQVKYYTDIITLIGIDYTCSHSITLYQSELKLSVYESWNDIDLNDLSVFKLQQVDIEQAIDEVKFAR